MAVRKEVKVLRECGYRKVGGLYLVGPLLSRVCDRLPYKIKSCFVCGRSFQFNRGIAQVTGQEVFYMPHTIDGIGEGVVVERYGANLDHCMYKHKDSELAGCTCDANCPVCYPQEERAALLWIDKKFYTPESFTKEAERLGVSKRLPYIPKWLKLGEAWVFLAHPEAVEIEGAPGKNGGDQGKFFAKVPGVFLAFVPQRIEKIVVEKEAEHFSQEAIDKLDAQGIDIVTVPWGDPDHR